MRRRTLPGSPSRTRVSRCGITGERRVGAVPSRRGCAPGLVGTRIGLAVDNRDVDGWRFPQRIVHRAVGDGRVQGLCKTGSASLRARSPGDGSGQREPVVGLFCDIRRVRRDRHRAVQPSGRSCCWPPVAVTIAATTEGPFVPRPTGSFGPFADTADESGWKQATKARPKGTR